MAPIVLVHGVTMNKLLPRFARTCPHCGHVIFRPDGRCVTCVPLTHQEKWELWFASFAAQIARDVRKAMRSYHTATTGHLMGWRGRTEVYCPRCGLSEYFTTDDARGMLLAVFDFSGAPTPKLPDPDAD
jgi:uncharacterized Zn finger protein (UPF0148 family)